MTTEYKNEVSDLFEDFKNDNVIAKFSETATLRAILGHNLKGLSVLDIGCGYGYHSRWIAAAGAVVTGVDCSEDQIKKALELEQRDPRGINFLIADAAYLPKTNQYDICLLIYMIQCANNESELTQFIFSASNNLKPGGRIISVFNNCYDPKIVEKYGYRIPDGALSAKPGEVYTGSSADSKTGEQKFICNQLKVDKELIERVARRAGFKAVTWVNPTVSVEGIEKYGEEFWHDFVSIPVDQYFILIK